MKKGLKKYRNYLKMKIEQMRKLEREYKIIKAMSALTESLGVTLLINLAE